MSIASAEEMRAVGHALGQALAHAAPEPVVIGIEGELGAGKTTLVGGVLNAVGVAGPVRSPTYTLIEPYETARRHLYHLDLYRLSDPREVEALGIRDLLVPRTVLLIEWPSHGAGALPRTDLDVTIEYPPVGAAGRQIAFIANSAPGRKLMQPLIAVKGK